MGDNSTTQRSSPTQVGSDTNWSKIGGGVSHFLATKTDGTLWGWGQNNYGQLGINNRTEYSSPVQIPGGVWTSNQIGSAAGGYTSLVILEDTSV